MRLSFQTGPVEVQDIHVHIKLYSRNEGHYYETYTFKHTIWIIFPKKAYCLLIELSLASYLAYIFIYDMNYDCAKFYTNI